MTSQWRSVAAQAVLLGPAVLIAGTSKALAGWGLYSEPEVMEANVLHPLFNSQEHFAPEYWKPSMRQRERLDALSLTFHRTAAALRAVGIDAFLESAGLIGWLRHNKSQLPWDTDGDIGVLGEQCRSANASKSDVQKAIGEDFLVLKFACSCEEDCEGDDRRMAGRITHKLSGVCIDIFIYGPVKEHRSWQKAERYRGVEWWERHDDHADFTFPKESLMPLQSAEFEGQSVLLPADPSDFLSWEYGRCLGVHVWPWRLLVYTPVSVLIPAAIIGKGAVLLSSSGGRSTWLAVLLGAYGAVAMAVLRNGILIVVLFGSTLLELLAVSLKPELVASSIRARFRVALMVVLAVLLFELRGLVSQLWCQIDDFHLRPRRPKTWTLCLLGKCWDF